MSDKFIGLYHERLEWFLVRIPVLTVFLDANFLCSTVTVTFTITQPTNSLKANYRHTGICLGGHGSLPRFLLGLAPAVLGSFSCSKSGWTVNHCISS